MVRTLVVSHHCFDGKLSAKHDFGSGCAVLCCAGWWSAMVSLWCTLLEVDIYCLRLLDIYCLLLSDIYFYCLLLRYLLYASVQCLLLSAAVRYLLSAALKYLLSVY